MRWQRATRLIVALIGLACATALVVYAHRRTRATAPRSTVLMDPKATSESNGVTTLRLNGNKEELTYDAAHQTEYADGRRRLEHVHFTTMRGDRKYEIWTDVALGQGKGHVGDDGRLAFAHCS